MPISDLVFASILGVVGAAIIAYLALVIISPLLRFKPVVRGGSKVRKAAQRLKIVDTLISENRFKEASAELRRAIILDVVSSREMVERLRDHNQSVLSRCLVVAEEMGSRCDGLADTERLMRERNELLILLLKAEEALRSFLGRREQAGKSVPKWSKGDFQGKINDIKKEISTNQTQLRASLDELFESIENASPSGSITYH